MPLGGKKERRDLERISFDKYIKCQSCILIIRFRDPLFFLLQALLLKCQNKLKVKPRQPTSSFSRTVQLK